MASFEFKALHADRWDKLLPKLTAAGKDGYHVVGFLSEGGCYSALLERGQPDIVIAVPPMDLQMNHRTGTIEDRTPEYAKDWVRVGHDVLPVALGPREQVYQPLDRREEDDLENEEGA